MAAWQWLSFTMQHYLPSHKFGKACIWNCFLLASLVGHLVMYNSLLLMTTTKTLQKYKLHIFSAIPLYVSFMNDWHVISKELNLKTSRHQARLQCSTMPCMASVSQVKKMETKQNLICVSIFFCHRGVISACFILLLRSFNHTQLFQLNYLSFPSKLCPHTLVGS